MKVENTKMISNLLNFSLLINIVFSLTIGYLTMKMIPSLINKFLQAKRFGIDVNKKSKPKIPESFGVVAGCMFLINCFLFMLIPFGQLITQPENFSHNEFVEMLASLLSICCMLLLGFADDVFDLRWRHKLFLPVLASLPLLVVYYINFNSTTVLLPKQFRHILGSTINLGIFYYVYMAMLAVFCTNAINILAGVNGLEVGQSVIIAFSILILNVIELTNSFSHSHLLSLYYIVPFLAVSIPLLKYNWCPARIFIGDTFCYFAGMLFAVVGILGHFSKTLLLFFIPQIFNFLYSLPQLFHFIPCPRHRLPQLSNDGRLEMSRVQFSLNELPHLGRIFFELFHKLRLIKVIERKGDHIMCNNFTLINLMLLIFGPTYEETLTTRLLILQVICSVIAFSIRYPLAAYFYDV